MTTRETLRGGLIAGLLATVILGLALSQSSGHAQAVDPALAEAYNAGLEAANAGNFDLARTKFEAALAIDPKYKDAHYNLGLVLQNLQQYADAAKHFAKTLELDPSHAAALRLHAEALFRSNQYGPAVIAYDKALAADSTNADLLYPAADVTSKAFPETDGLPKVVAAFERALRLAPKDSRAFSAAVSLGTIYSRNEDFNGALRAYKKASEMNPKSDTPHYNSAVVYQKLNKHQDAVQSLDKALAIDPSSGKAHYLLATIYYNQLKDDQKALEHYDLAAADPNFKSRDKARQSATAIRDYLEKKKAQEEKAAAGQ